MSSCNIVFVGKNRNGTNRYWCTTHHAPAYGKNGVQLEECLSTFKDFQRNKPSIDLNPEDYPGGIALWCYILKELYNLYKDMGGTGNLLARFYCGTVLFYGAEVNRHRIVQEKRYLVIGQKFSNGMVYHYAMG